MTVHDSMTVHVECTVIVSLHLAMLTKRGHDTKFSRSNRMLNCTYPMKKKQREKAGPGANNKCVYLVEDNRTKEAARKPNVRL